RRRRSRRRPRGGSRAGGHALSGGADDHVVARRRRRTRDVDPRGRRMTEPITIIPVAGIGEIAAGDDLAGIIAGATTLVDGDVVVVTQKIVSKAEAMLEAVDPDDPLSHKAIVERESVRVLRRRGDLIISETKHGFV